VIRKLVTAAAFAAALAPLSALAQDATEQARMLFNAGAQAYEAGKYPAAIQAFNEAYKLTARPGILFSLAQAYRRQYTADKQPANLMAAIKHYREYIAKVEQGGRRADAIAALGELEPMAERMGAAAAAPPPPPERKPQTQIMVSTQTKDASIALDGGKPVEAPLIAEVKPGKHKVQVSAPGFFPEEREIAAGEGIVALDIALREKPGLLTVVAKGGADVSIDGRLVATTPLDRPIEVAPGRRYVVVQKRGHRPVAEDVDLGRGESKRLDVNLDVTNQRIGAYVLMGVGAAGIVGGGAVAGLAVYEQHKAQDLDTRRQKQGGLSSSELKDYNQAKSMRDDMRRVAGGLLGGAFAVGVTGVLLAVFDSPAVGATTRRDEAPKPEKPAPRERSMEMAAVPIVTPGFYGLSVSARF
jgi:hypothetical protein